MLEDDAVVCADLLAGLEAALAHVPDDVGLVSPYLGQVRPHTAVFLGLVNEAERVGASWIREESAWWGVALAARTEMVPAMLDHCDGLTFAYDTRLGHWVRRVARLGVLYPWPSLVDHRAGPSLVGHGGSGARRAHRFHEGSALDLDWSGPVVSEAPPTLLGKQPGRVKTIVRG